MSKAGRIILLRLLGNECEICGSKKGLSIHHINEDQTDDDIKNLELLCNSCHGKSHDNTLRDMRIKNYEVTDEGIIEYLSRPARAKIVNELCSALLTDHHLFVEKNGRKGRGRPHTSGVCLLASLLGVSRKSVRRWIAGEMQSSNVNARRLLTFAVEFIPKVLEEVLVSDLRRHRAEVESFLYTHGGDP